MTYLPNTNRYDSIPYNRVGNSGLKLPAISLGLWNNFGSHDVLDNQRNLLKKAFDLGITHFDLANNYGPPYGSAEENFGRILKQDFSGYRDEMIISSKAGFDMWPGPYGDWGSKKHLIASLDQSLRRMDLEYVDIFYHHRPDPDTPLEETMAALDLIVRQGKALYVGLSNYDVVETEKAIQILKQQGTPFIIHQAAYSMFDRSVENGLTDLLKREGAGCIAFVPLAQGLLTNKYLDGIPKDSRAAKDYILSLNEKDITPDVIGKVQRLHDIAAERNQSLAQMALMWVLQEKSLASVLIGASKVSQIEENIKAFENANFTQEELQRIDKVLGS